MLYKVVLTFKSVDETGVVCMCVTIQMKAIEQYFRLVLFALDNLVKLNSRLFPQLLVVKGLNWEKTPPFVLFLSSISSESVWKTWYETQQTRNRIF